MWKPILLFYNSILANKHTHSHKHTHTHRDNQWELFKTLVTGMGLSQYILTETTALLGKLLPQIGTFFLKKIHLTQYVIWYLNVLDLVM